MSGRIETVTIKKRWAQNVSSFNAEPGKKIAEMERKGYDFVSMTEAGRFTAGWAWIIMFRSRY